jgi:hypothetical protein
VRRNVEEVGTRAGQSNETPAPGFEIGIERFEKNAAGRSA